MVADLFHESESKGSPLADRMRPQTLDEFVGQEHLIGEGKILRRAIEAGEIPSLILWGPPGSGKTTLAHLLARLTGHRLVPLSAVMSGIPEVRRVIAEAEKLKKLRGEQTILFIDEIHRFNKSQQDALLPHIERGTVIFIGATTENPSFEVISALLSRCRVVVLKPLISEQVESIVWRAARDERGLASEYEVDNQAVKFIADYSAGDARVALNAIELAANAVKDAGSPKRITLELAKEAMQRTHLLYDKKGEEHYNIISAYIKSLRGSDPDAALYWLARMLAGGEDPLFIARRMVIFASEDVSNADPMGLVVATSAYHGVHFVGLPEAELILAHATTYLACAPKSNASYMALAKAKEDVERLGPLAVPLFVRNAPTRLMKDMGYSKGYRYDHSSPDHFAAQDHLPKELRGRIYYEPTEQGYEERIRKRLERWRSIRKERGRIPPDDE